MKAFVTNFKKTASNLLHGALDHRIGTEDGRHPSGHQQPLLAVKLFKMVWRSDVTRHQTLRVPWRVGDIEVNEEKRLDC